MLLGIGCTIAMVTNIKTERGQRMGGEEDILTPRKAGLAKQH